jgi:hypothetical protein
MADISFSVDPASLPVVSYAHILYGTKDPAITTMTVNGQSGRITFPTSATWRLELILSPGENVLRIQGQDAYANLTATLEVTLELKGFEVDDHSYFNVLDDHGIPIGLDRNRGEKNWEFRTRLISFASAQTGAHIEGLFLALAHELGIKPVDQALGVRVKRDAYNQLPSTTAYFEITPVYVFIDADELFQEREAHLVEPRSRSFELDYRPLAADKVELTDAEGKPIPIRNYEVDLREQKVTFDSTEYNGSWVVARYAYRYSIDYRTLTLAELQTQLEAITVGGAQLLEVEVEDGTLIAYGLMRWGRRLLDDSYTYVPQARVQVTGLDDKDYQESLLNALGTAFDTKLEEFARRSTERSNLGWDNLILDEGLWDEDADTRAIDFLPRLFDAVFGRWYCTDPTDGNTYTLDDYRLYNGYCPNHPTSQLKYRGVDEELVHSGVGAPDDLTPTAEEVTEEL